MSSGGFTLGPEASPNMTPAIFVPFTVATSVVVTPLPPTAVVPAGTLNDTAGAGPRVVMGTSEESARVQLHMAVTTNVPATEPAVNKPLVVRVPPVALKVTVYG